MQVLLFHLFGKLKVRQRVAFFGCKQKRRKPLGRQVLRRMPREDLPHSGHCGGGHLFNKSGLVDGVPVGILQHFHHAPLW